MKKLIKNNYLFIILFILIIIKDPIYRLYKIKDNIYTPLVCSIKEDDYNKLLEFNEIDYIYESNYINTYIIYKDIYNYMNEITIRGGKDKNLSNNVVVYDNTLLGIIDRVDKTSSIVKLLTNKRSKISVKINDEIGVLQYIKGNLIVNNISNYSNIKIGDMIYTSGLGIVKENIYIGTVKDIKFDNKNIGKIIYVDYQLNIKDIDYVTVIKESK
jgi:cell shape-determining protein MreC